MFAVVERLKYVQLVFAVVDRFEMDASIHHVLDNAME